MNTPSYRSARALFPHRPELWEPDYLYEPLPVPEDHPELDLFGIARVRRGHEAEDVGAPDESAPPGQARSLSSPQPGVQDVLPARMLNEFVYCPRLFYYEHVEGVFLNNADTERGSAIHEKVDRGKGALPKARKKKQTEEEMPEAEAQSGTAMNEGGEPDLADLKTHEPLPEPEIKNHEAKVDVIHSRSAMMSSERLGVIAKMDLIEVKMQIVDDPAGLVRAAEARRADLSPHPIDQTPALAGSGALPESPTSPARRSAKKTRCEAPPEPDLFTSRVQPGAQAYQAPANPGSGEGSHTARIQHVDVRRREVRCVTPVDYKAGAPKIGFEANELWDADKMQLGLQILILRDNGYACDEGVIYYSATKQRVPLTMTPELEAWIITQTTMAREATASPTIPPPLVNSPKCVRCSLAPICLPDETRLLKWSAQSPVRNPQNSTGDSADHSAPRNLAASPATAPRRLIAARDDERALYLNTQGCRVGIKSGRLIIKDGESVIDEVRMIDVSHVALFGNIQISTQAVQELCGQEIPVAYFSMGGWFFGLTRGHGLKNVHTRIRQFAVAANPLHSLMLARRIVRGKIRSHRKMLMRNHIQPPAAALTGLDEISSRTSDARGMDELLGMEGAAAALYFQHFSGMIKVGADDLLEDEIPGLDISHENAAKKRLAEAETFRFDFTKRRRRPPTDPVNALLSMAYSLLAKDCTIAALAVGFDPYIGFFHQPRHGRPSLALDLMEEFRPLIAESAVLTAINNRMITPGHFVRAGDAVNLTAHGRKAFFHAYEQRMNALITHPVFEYKVSYRRVLELQARLLARWLTGEIPDYIPMATR